MQAWVAIVDCFGLGGDFFSGALIASGFGGSGNGGFTSAFFDSTYDVFFYSTLVGKNLGFSFSTGLIYGKGFG